MNHALENYMEGLSPMKSINYNATRKNQRSVRQPKQHGEAIVCRVCSSKKQLHKDTEGYLCGRCKG